MYEGRLNDLGLLRGCSSADCRRRGAVGVGHIAICVAVCQLALRGRLVYRCEDSVCAWRNQTRRAHGRGRGRRDVHWVSRGRQRGAGRGQDGNGPVHVRIVVARKRAAASLCHRGHGVETQRGATAAMLRCWAATPVRALKNSALEPGCGFGGEELFWQSAETLLDRAAGSRYRADWRCGATTGGVVPERSAAQSPAAARCYESGATEEQRVAVAPGSSSGAVLQRWELGEAWDCLQHLQRGMHGFGFHGWLCRSRRMHGASTWAETGSSAGRKGSC